MAADGVLGCKVKLEIFGYPDLEAPLASIDVNMIKKEGETASSNECKFCKGIYNSFENLDDHIRRVHSNSVKCNVCDMELTKKHYRHHLRKIHGITQLQPEGNDENKWSNKGGNVENAEGSIREEDVMGLCEAITKEGPSGDHSKGARVCYEGVECQICNQVYSNDVNLKKHVYNVHRMVRVKCRVCSKEINKKSLDRHMKNVHSTKVSFKRIRKPGPDEKDCSICGKKCSNLATLKSHVRTVHDSEQRKCTQCEYHGTRKFMEKHMKKAHNEEVYQCGRCQKILKSKSTLKEHMWIHTDHRRFICDICGMRFKRTSNYHGHMKSHQEKKFQCRICGNFFLRKRYLAIHEQTIHNYYGEGVPPQEKGYQCEICGVKLKWKNNLLAHMRIHTGEKPYKCKICCDDFTCHGSLRTHMAKHCK